MMVTDWPVEIEVDTAQVCRCMGYAHEDNVPARVSSLVAEYVENAPSLIEPCYSYAIRDIEWSIGSIVVIEGPIIFRSQRLHRLLSKCDKVAALVTTIGTHLEETVHSLAQEGLLSQATVLDAIGSATVERLAETARAAIAETAWRYGLIASSRFSPGYCDWDVEQQKLLFQAIGENTAGVHLTDGCLMAPRKSISGIIGLGSPDSGIASYDPCHGCTETDCIGRQACPKT